MKSILDKKIEKYCRWYYENIVKQDSGEPYTDRNLAINTIQKMASWYELIYPDDYFKDDSERINNMMLNQNKYLDLEDEDSINKPNLKWNKYFTFTEFYEMLSEEERDFFTIPNFSRSIQLMNNYFYDHIHINSEGVVTEADLSFLKSRFSPFKLENCSLKDALEIFEKSPLVTNIGEIRNLVKEIDIQKYKKEGFLGSVMYMILERGGLRIGPRRAMLFAKEFNRSIEVPMIYGIDESDPNLSEFIDDYLSSGGNPNIMCYKKYYLKDYNKIKLTEIDDYKKLVKKIEE